MPCKKRDNAERVTKAPCQVPLNCTPPSSQRSRSTNKMEGDDIASAHPRTVPPLLLLGLPVRGVGRAGTVELTATDCEVEQRSDEPYEDDEDNPHQTAVSGRFPRAGRMAQEIDQSPDHEHWGGEGKECEDREAGNGDAQVCHFRSRWSGLSARDHRVTPTAQRSRTTTARLRAAPFRTHRSDRTAPNSTRSEQHGSEHHRSEHHRAATVV